MSSQKNSPSRALTVPRDRDVDTAESSRQNLTPNPDTVNIRDEDYSAGDKPLVPGSPEARALQQNPPQGRDQLQVGSAGDAARPDKTGIMKPTLPPRAQMK